MKKIFSGAETFRKRQKSRKKSEFKISKSFLEFKSEKFAKNPVLDHSKIFFGKTGFFPGNPALSLFIIYDSLNNCQKSWQSLVRLSGKVDCGQTN